MDLDQSWWSCSKLNRSTKHWADLNGPGWVLSDGCMALTALNGWDKYKVARKVLGSLVTVLAVLENVLVVWSGRRDFESSVIWSDG